jgi:hypothetical protein
MTMRADDEADDVAGAEAPLIDHLTELRMRLLVSIGFFFPVFFVCLAFASDIFAFLLVPYERAAGAGVELELIYTAPHEFFFTQIKLALFAALFISFPMLAFQLYRFVAPGFTAMKSAFFCRFSWRRRFYSSAARRWCISSSCRSRLGFFSRWKYWAQAGRMCVCSIVLANICPLRWCSCWPLAFVFSFRLS